MNKKIGFLSILVIFAFIYISINYNIPILGNIGVVAYVLVALSQVIT